MVVKGTYFQNDKDHPLVYGDINLINPPRRRLRGEDKTRRRIRGSYILLLNTIG